MIESRVFHFRKNRFLENWIKIDLTIIELNAFSFKNRFVYKNVYKNTKNICV